MRLLKNMRLLRCSHTHHRKTVPPIFLAREMAESTRDLAIYLKESVVRGHHVFKRIWTPVVGEILAVDVESGNAEDRYAVAVSIDNREKAVHNRERIMSTTNPYGS